MTEQMSLEVKEEILKLVSTPGVEIEDIPARLKRTFNFEITYEEIMAFLSDEYLKHNLDYGRRLCCKF